MFAVCSEEDLKVIFKKKICKASYYPYLKREKDNLYASTSCLKGQSGKANRKI